ncbi:MAG: AI-2E family transporter, partial [Clostridia bacterium]|nr:AI-2E family transporter [Clostridia bacterium]
MKKIDTKSLIKVALVIFALYLGIHYWTHAANILKTLLGAAIPLVIGAVISYPLNILMSFYEKHLFPKSEKKLAVKSRRGLALTLAILTLVGIIALIIA